MIISIDVEKPFDKIQHQFMIKTLSKVGIEELTQHDKVHICKTQSQHHTHWEKLKVFSLRAGRRQGCLLLTPLFNIVLEVLATAVKQKEEIKGIQIGKEDVKLIIHK